KTAARAMKNAMRCMSAPPARKIGGRDTSTASARSPLWSRSAALPVGLALLEERAHALLEILAQVARQDNVLGIAECRSGREAPRGLLHGGQRQRRQLGQTLGQLANVRLEPIAGVHLVDEADGVSLGDVDQPRGEENVAGPDGADGVGEEREGQRRRAV